MLANDFIYRCGHCGFGNRFNKPLTFGDNITCASCMKTYRVGNAIEAKPRGIPNLLESLDKIRELHLRKNEDYADANNAFSNFEFTEFVLKHFTSDRDKSFVWPIATKMARLSTLLNSNRHPNNESIEDSLLDIATYVLLWKADISRRTLNFTAPSQKDDSLSQP